MEERGNNNRFPFKSILGVALAIMAAGGGLTWFALERMKSAQSPPRTTPTPSPNLVNPPAVSPSPKTTELIPAKPEPKPATETVQVYWFDGTSGEVSLNPLPVSIQKSENKSQTLKQALTLLLQGPVDANHTTTIPKGTRLLGLSRHGEGIHVDLSAEFTQEDGSKMMVGRLAQVLYTATSLDPDAQVWIDVEGEPLEVLGEGHGLIIDRPMTRQIFEENFELNGEE
jgi:spore germination protein GerM